jgi:hypothetical protein
MKLNDMVFVEYATGECFTGEVVSLKNMPGERLLFTLKVEQGYRSMYLDKCVSLDYLSTAS